MFIPGRKIFICANTKQQAAQITKEKIYEIYDHWPLLKKEVVGSELKEYPGNFGRDYVSISFRNGSKLDVVLAGDAARGGRRHGLKKTSSSSILQSFYKIFYLYIEDISRRK